MAAFERFQKLPQEKLTYISSELLRGTPAMALARKIQQDWGDFTDVAEATLTQQLNRYRQTFAEEAFGPEVARKLDQAPTVKAKTKVLGAISTLNALEEMEQLAMVQKRRILRVADKEATMPMLIPGLNEVIRDQSKLLQDLQKVRFELGLDEFKGVVAGVRAGSVTETRADGSTIHKSIYEAVDTVESILAKRGI